jgi:F-type H+-transporting ATPase subunit b
LLDRIAKQGEDLRKELEAKAREQAEGLIARARAEIQQEREKAVQDLREQVADLAVMAAGRIIGESLDAKKHRELIERAIEEAEIRA